MGRQKKVLNCHKTEVLNKLLIDSTLLGNLADVRKWIDQGANVNANLKVKDDKLEFTPLDAAIIGEHLKHEDPPKSNYIFKLLTEKGADMNHFEIFKLLIEKGADVNQLVWSVQQNGFYPLIFMAITHGLEKFVEHLMTKGADLNYRFRDNTNFLTLAVENNHLNIAKMLLKRRNVKSKIDIRHKKFDGTALDFAVKNKFDEMAKLLIDHGANVNVRDSKFHYSVLHSACRTGSLDIVKLLIEKGADIEAKTPDGLTPLMAAVISKKVTIVQYLLEQGANPNLRGGVEQVTALHIILTEPKGVDKINEIMIFRLLIKHGAWIDMTYGGKLVF